MFKGLNCFFCVLLAGTMLAQAPVAKSKKSGATPAAAKSHRVIANLSGFELQRGANTTMTGGASRGGARPVALAPMLAKLYSRQPTFEWSADAGSGPFTFALLNDSLENLFTAKATGLSFSYPATAPQLEDGKTYYWTVTDAQGDASIVVGFQVLTSEERQAIAAQLASGGDSEMKAGSIFTDQRLWYDAIAAYSRAIASDANNARAYESRGMIYAQLPATKPRAAQDFSRADALSARTAK